MSPLHFRELECAANLPDKLIERRRSRFGNYLRRLSLGRRRAASGRKSFAFGQVLCLVEAMKVFNEIPAECAGKIAAVLVENSAAVEYGQKLFRVE